MVKPNYIAETGEWTRRLATAALAAAMIICSACFSITIAVAILIFPNESNAPVFQLAGCIVIFGLLTLATSWMTIRLIRHERAANGRTVMPELFIQLFGILFLCGVVATAILNRNLWLVLEGVGIALAMIGIRSLIQRQGKTGVADSIALTDVDDSSE